MFAHSHWRTLAWELSLHGTPLSILRTTLGEGSIVISIIQMGKHSLGTKCSQDHRACQWWTGNSQPGLCVQRPSPHPPSFPPWLSLAHRRGLSTSDPVPSSPQCGRPKDGTGKPGHRVFAHTLPLTGLLPLPPSPACRAPIPCSPPELVSSALSSATPFPPLGP